MTQLHTANPARTALITGSAVRVGAALAEHLAAAGWNLVLHYRRSHEAAQALAARLEKAHRVQITLMQSDLRDMDAATRFWEGLPPCDALIHNAAIFTRDTLAGMHAATLRDHLAVNLEAPLLLSQGFMKQLPGQGSIIVLGDGVLGWSISPEFFSYAVSKQAWLGTLDILASACAPRARVNMLALAPTLPGATDTPEMFDRLAARAPLKRTGELADVCNAVSYLLDAQNVTGQVISLAAGAGLSSHRTQNA